MTNAPVNAEPDYRGCARPDERYCTTCAVRSRSICSHFSDSEFSHAETVMTHKYFPKGRSILREGEANDSLFVVVEGSLRLCKFLNDGRRQITGFAFPGELIGVQRTDASSYAAETLEDCYLCRFPHGFIDQVAMRSSVVKDRLITQGQTDYKKAQDHIVLLGKRSAEERVVCFFENMRAFGTRVSAQGGVRIPLSMPRGDIADYLGLRFETMSRTFAALTNKGVLSKVTRRSVVFHR